MKAWIKKTIASSLLLCTLATAAIMAISHSEAYAQFLDSYHALSKPEQEWTKRHLWAAFRTHKLADTARACALEHRNDDDLDGDLTGGMADAFKHTLWMALTAQKIGKEKAISLGIAHEQGNYEQFLANPQRERNLVQDKIASDMDLFNNEVGVQIGADYPRASISVLIFLVKQAVTQGRCRKILKDSSGHYLDSQGRIIDTNNFKGIWEIPKVLIQSSKPQLD